MTKFSRFWNGSVGGIPSAVCLLAFALSSRVLDKVTTTFWSRNLSAFGKGSQIQQGVSIRSPGQVKVGDNVNIGRKVRMDAEIESGRLEISSGSQINTGCLIDFSGDLVIGEDVVLSEGCMIYTHSHGLNPKSIPKPSKLVIEAEVWLGARVIILPGVGRIGKGAVVGAGAVVSKKIDAGMIVAGNPARVIRNTTE